MQPGRTYHIYNHGNADDNLFRSDENYLYFLQKYSLYALPVVKTYAYCLLPNHFHLLVKVNDEDSFASLKGFERLTGWKLEARIIQQFGNFFNSYAKAFNKMYDRRGKLFLLPFRRKRIADSRHFLSTWRYIHYNPVHHQFTDNAFEWEFSSIHDYRSKGSSLISVLDAERRAESKFKGLDAIDFKPSWNDFLDLDY